MGKIQASIAHTCAVADVRQTPLFLFILRQNVMYRICHKFYLHSEFLDTFSLTKAILKNLLWGLFYQNLWSGKYNGNSDSTIQKAKSKPYREIFGGKRESKHKRCKWLSRIT